MSQSPTDHEALEEIARLIAEKDGNGSGDESGPSAGAPGGDPPDEAAAALDATLLGRLFESIPAAIAIIRDSRLIRANESFAMAFGFASMAELIDAGGLVRIFSGASSKLFTAPDTVQNGEQDADPSPAGERLNLEARSKSGRKIEVPAIRHRAPGGIDLLILHPASEQAAVDRAQPEPQAVPEPPPGPVSMAADNSQQTNPNAEKDETADAPARPTDDNAIELLAKVSHEVRTPLNSIIGFAELMKHEQFGPLGHAKYRGYAEDIVNSGNYALGIINDLLDLSKIRSGNFELNFTAVDVNEVIEDCVHLIEAQARQDRVVLRISLEDEVPQVLADRRSLKQILLNLLSNAVKFTKAGGQVIVSSALETGGDLLIRVRDTGVGMSKEDIELALKPFQQLDTAPREQVGTGLGLPLTKALAEANRASVRIESARRVGTSIDIRFPADRVLKD